MFSIICCSLITITTCLIFNHFQLQKIQLQQNLIEKLQKTLLIENTNNENQNLIIFFNEKLLKLAQNQNEINILITNLCIEHSQQIYNLNRMAHHSYFAIYNLSKQNPTLLLEQKKLLIEFTKMLGTYKNINEIPKPLTNTYFDLITNKNNSFFQQIVNSKYQSNFDILQLKKIGLDLSISDFGQNLILNLTI